MVNTTFHPRQASIRKIDRTISPTLLFFLAGMFLAGCRTPPPPTAGSAAATGVPEQKTIAFLAPGRNRSVIPAPKPLPATDVPIAPSTNTNIAVPLQKEAPPLPIVTTNRHNVEPLPDIPNDIQNWRITRVSASEWKATPTRRRTLSDAPPSLMEDAIITSGIHSRLQSVPALRNTTWKYSSNAGNIALASPELTCDQALAALKAVVGLEKVAEVRLTTNLR